MKSNAGQAATVVITALFAATFALSFVTLATTVPQTLSTARDELRLVSASSLELRARPARDGSISLERWACPGIEKHADILRVAAPHAGFMGLRMVYVRGGPAEASLEGSRILMASLFPAAFCAPLSADLFAIGLRDATDWRFASISKGLSGTEIFLIDSMDAQTVQALLATQPSRGSQHSLSLLRSLGPNTHLLSSHALMELARAGDPSHADLRALLP